MTPDIATLLLFIPAALALNLTPGADMMFCLGQGLRGGPRAALAADAGIAAGAMIHTAMAGLGLGAIVAASPWVFDAIRWSGIVYLLWLAFGALHTDFNADIPTVHPGRAFREALLVNLTNPKVILFVLAFIPQFVTPDGNVLAQFLIFGAIISAGGLLVNGTVGVFAGGIGRKLSKSTRLATALKWTSAGIFCALALKLAVTERS